MHASDYLEKADALLRAGQWEDAVEQLKLAQAIDPDSGAVQLMFYSAYKSAATASGSQRDRSLYDKRAKKHFQAFRKLEPDAAKEMLAQMPSFMSDELR